MYEAKRGEPLTLILNVETFTRLLPTALHGSHIFVFVRKLQQLREFGACNAYGQLSMRLLLAKITKK